MFTEDKVTEIFFMADEFCGFFDSIMEKYALRDHKKRIYHRESTMSKSEIMVIIILFHNSGYRCLKHFYVEQVCRHMRHLFPKVVSYNRFVELERDVAIPLALFIKKVLLGKCTGISFVDSTKISVCHNKRITRNKVFKDYAEIGKSTMGWYFGFKCVPYKNVEWETMWAPHLTENINQAGKDYQRHILRSWLDFHF